jgi:hypothetical protein
LDIAQIRKASGECREFRTEPMIFRKTPAKMVSFG